MGYVGSPRCEGELGKWVVVKGAWELHDWLHQASSFWAGHMASLNKNMDPEGMRKKGIAIEKQLMVHAAGTFRLPISKTIIYLSIVNKLTCIGYR